MALDKAEDHEARIKKAARKLKVHPNQIHDIR
eukprot:COSAG02_NODE_41787_length_391_cov_0.534247_2_plen_31_part_01